MHADDMWLASALEGFLVASFLQTVSLAVYSSLRGILYCFQKEQVDSKFLSKDYFVGVLEKIKEILALYEESRISLLAADTCIKIASIHAHLKSKSDTNTYLSKAWSFADGLASDEKIYASSRIAKLYRDIGFDRKFAFFTRILAQLTVKVTNPFLALACYKRILPYYKLEKTFKRDGDNRQLALGWPLIQKIIMKEVMDVSMITKDLEVITFFTTHFLRQLHHHIGASEQQEMMDKLKRMALQPLKEKTLFNLNSIIDNVNSSFTGLPVVRKVELLP